MGSYKRANYEMSTEMISNSRKGAFMAKQEDDISDGKFLKPSNSRQWSGFRNPRIVTVSRSLGGKDRHSKVCTIRGLRDRRIRLSVPTAVQLYDLQDRLGLGQPSKVIDWLLESTKHDIDKLPPLQFPQRCGEFHPQSLVLPYESSASQFSITPSFIDAALASRVGENQGLGAKSKYWDMNLLSSAKLAAEDGRGSTEKGECIKSTEGHENKYGLGGYGNRASAQKITSESSLPSFLNNAFPYSSYHSDPSSFCLSHFGSHGTVSSQLEPNNGSTAVPLSVPSGSQLFFCPSVNATVSPIFASYPQYISTPVDSDPRLLNHIQFVSSSSQVLPPSLLPSTYTNSSSLKSFPTQLSAKLVGSDQSHNQNQLDKDKAGS